MTKFIAIFAAVALLAMVGFATVAPAKAQTVTTEVQAPLVGAAYNNPISQWIVLSGLFAPYYAYGTPAGGVAGGAFYNPISQWIVLSGLFAPTALVPTTATVVDP